MGKDIIRRVKEIDAAEILKIYEPYVAYTAISFEHEVPSLDEFSKRITGIAAVYAFLVYLVDGKIVGYAYANRLRERAAYQWNAELTVYVDRAYLRRGVGKALYGCLIEVLKLQNIKNVYGCVVSPNPNSEKLHEYFKFNKLGVYHNTGYKCGAWRDVMWFEKSIGTYDDKPSPFVPISQIDNSQIDKIIKGFARN